MPNSSWQISPDPLYQEIGGDAVILCSRLAMEYEANADLIAHCVAGFLQQMQAAGLLRVAAN